MRKIYLAAFVLGVALGASIEIRSQTFDAQAKAQEIAQLFNKTKHKIKEKGTIKIEIFVDIKSEPAVRQNISEYSGNYKSETGDSFELKVSSDGMIEAGGSEPAPQKSRRFTLKNAKIEGALLIGTKVYEDGSTEKFEAVFLKRTIRNGQDDVGAADFGLGVRYDPPKTDASEGFVINKLFYELK